MQLALLLSVAAPAMVGAVLAGLALVAGSKRAAVLAFAAPAGALAAYVPVRGLPDLPPTDASVWPLWLGFVVAAYVALQSLLRVPPLVRTGVRALLSAVTVYLVSAPLIDHSWSTGATVAVLGCSTVGVVVGWSFLERRAEVLPGPAVPLVVAGLAAASAGVLGLSGTALLAQAAGGIAGATGVLVLVGAWRSSSEFGSIVGPAALMLGALLTGGANYAEVGWASLALSLVGLWAVALIPLPGALRTGWRSAAALGAMVAVFNGAALASSLVPSGPSDRSSGGNEDYDGYGTSSDDAYDY